MRHARVAGVFLLTMAAASIFLGLVQAQQIHRNGFETRQTCWIKGGADSAFREIVHDITDAMQRTGQYSEHLQINAEQGTKIYYYYPTSKAPIGDELSLNLWLRANRPGMQLMARLVLPKERN